MMFLLFYNDRSERELMETLPERLDWLCFLESTIVRWVGWKDLLENYLFILLIHNSRP